MCGALIMILLFSCFRPPKILSRLRGLIGIVNRLDQVGQRELGEQDRPGKPSEQGSNDHPTTPRSTKQPAESAVARIPIKPPSGGDRDSGSCCRLPQNPFQAAAWW